MIEEEGEVFGVVWNVLKVNCGLDHKGRKWVLCVQISTFESHCVSKSESFASLRPLATLFGC
jgi:hypothetical protein